MKKFNWNGQTSFRRQIQLSFLFVSIVPIFILGAFLTFQSVRTYQEDLRTIKEENTRQLKETAAMKVRQINSSMEKIAFNSGLRAFLESQPTSAWQGYADFQTLFDPTIDYIYSSEPAIKEIRFYLDSPMVDTRENIQQLSTEQLPDYVKNYKPAASPTWQFNTQNIYVISSFLEYNPSTVIVFELNYNEFMKDIEKETKTYTSKLVSAKTSKDTVAIEGIDRALQIRFNENYLSKSTVHTMIGALMIIVVSIFSTLFIGNLLNKRLLTNLSSLNQKIKRVILNDYEVSFATENEDEFGQLSNLIEEMVASLKKLMNDIFQAKLEQKESEYKALVNQINSHFLYNTLSLINWKAIMIGSQEISAAAQNLSTFYRTSLNNGRVMIQLKQELSNVQAYIDLCLLMKPNQFTVDYDIDEEVLDFLIINLLIQPLVENAIEHGFKQNKEQAKLTIRLKKKGNEVRIVVEDNGVGMSEEEAEEVFSKDRKGYALGNIQKRIQFYYGLQYKVELHSRLGKGTSVEICLPQQLPKEEKL